MWERAGNIGLVIGHAALVRFENEKVKNSGRPPTDEFPQTRSRQAGSEEGILVTKPQDESNMGRQVLKIRK